MSCNLSESRQRDTFQRLLQICGDPYTIRDGTGSAIPWNLISLSGSLSASDVNINDWGSVSGSLASLSNLTSSQGLWTSSGDGISRESDVEITGNLDVSGTSSLGVLSAGDNSVDNHRITGSLSVSGSIHAVGKLLTDDRLSDGLVLHLGFDEALTGSASESILLDKSGYNNHGSGSASGSLMFITGKFGGALDFSASFVDVGDPVDNSLDFGTDTDFSIFAWIKIDSNTGNAKIIVKEGIDPRFYLSVSGNNNNSLRAVIDDGVTSIFNIFSEGNLTWIGDGRWHHVGVVFDRDGFAYPYLDGKLSVLGNLVDISVIGNMNNDNPLKIGLDPFDGQIDEVRVYRRIVTSEEVAALYAQGQTKFSENVIISSSPVIATSALKASLYSTGSTIFGGSPSVNIHRFTGSIEQTGSGATSYFIDRVGIGTTNPLSTFHISGSSNNIFRATYNQLTSSLIFNNNSDHTILQLTTVNTLRSCGIRLTSGADNWEVVNGADGKFRIQNGNVVSFEGGQLGRSFVISANGEVGIGSSIPRAVLDVTGSTIFGSNVSSHVHQFTGSIEQTGSGATSRFKDNIQITGTLFVSSSNETRFSVNNSNLFVSKSGFVGVGTSVPISQLHFQTDNLNIDISDMSDPVFIVESEDATIELVSDATVGSVGSRIAFTDVDGAGSLVNKFGIIKEHGLAGGLKWTVGTGNGVAANDTFLYFSSSYRIGMGREFEDPRATLHVSGSTILGANSTDKHEVTGSLSVSGTLSSIPVIAELHSGPGLVNQTMSAGWNDLDTVNQQGVVQGVNIIDGYRIGILVDGFYAVNYSLGHLQDKSYVYGISVDGADPADKTKISEVSQSFVTENFPHKSCILSLTSGSEVTLQQQVISNDTTIFRFANFNLYRIN